MIQNFLQGIERRRDIGEVHDPAGFGLERTSNADLYSERMAMHPGAFVVFRDIRQPVRGREGKSLVDDHLFLHYGMPSILCV